MISDMHVHSRSSHDSKATVSDIAESCIKAGISAFAVTDHFDVQYHGEIDILGVVDRSFREANDVAGAYRGRVKVLKGIEIGEGLWCKEYVERALDAHCFDVVLGSVHAVRYEGYTMPYSRIDFGAMTREDIYGYLSAYFNDLLETVEEIPCDIVSHLTCPLRYIVGKYGIGVDIARYGQQIDRILARIIERSLALEINTSCDSFFMPDREIIGKYRQMGGELITLGSDAHVPENVGKNFERAIAMLSKMGFENIYSFEGREAVKHKIQ